ncbi:aldehyde dehydrogenase family protein [Sphingopyxis kveilinensis]|uniref:aldehyde dehydrogenase family protein n=1 Tax=Sphingopyxis kveilinensis TaxID=3114367 RepID=UPI0030D505A2
MPQAFQTLIDGALRDCDRTLPVINPATLEPLGEAPLAALADIDRAIAGARRAFGEWARADIDRRRALLAAIADAVEADADTLARLLTQEQGKPIAEAQYEVAGTAGVFRATAMLDLPLEVLRDTPQERIVRERSPLGVVAAIVPWNFPLMLMALKVAPALLVGNSVVVKPAPTTPLTTLRFGELCASLVPAGLLNILVGGNDLGAALTGHPDIARISFTGSTATGRKVMASAAANLTRLGLELGGNDAAIVLGDAQIDRVAPTLVHAAMMNAGQVCLGVKRIYVHSSLYGDFCNAAAAVADALVIGDGLDPATHIGPVQNATQWEKAQHYRAIAATDGRLRSGGKPVDRPGYFIRPTIVSDIGDDSALVQEEQFCPIVPVLPYSNADDLVARVNAGPYGLGGSIWTSDPPAAFDLARRIDVGTMWVNKFMDLPPDIAVSGAKASGVGMTLGQEGLAEFTQARVINMALGA